MLNQRRYPYRSWKYFHHIPCLQTYTVHEKKWDGNKSIQYTGVESIHKASWSNVFLAPLLFRRLHLICFSFILSTSPLLMEKHWLSRRCGADLSCVGGIVCNAVFISVLPFSEIMLRTYWRVMPWQTDFFLLF